MSRRLRDRDIRRCGSCGGWVIIGRLCSVCSLRLQVECEEATRAALAARYERQQAALVEERRKAWL